MVVTVETTTILLAWSLNWKFQVIWIILTGAAAFQVATVKVGARNVAAAAKSAEPDAVLTSAKVAIAAVREATVSGLLGDSMG